MKDFLKAEYPTAHAFATIFCAFIVSLLLAGCDTGGGSTHYPDDGGGYCNSVGEHCSGSADCCGTALCEQGVCNDSHCVASGEHCGSSAECCGASICDQGICSGGSGCIGSGGHCTGFGDCCGSSICNNGICSPEAGQCADYGENCGGSQDCCGALLCNDQHLCR